MHEYRTKVVWKNDRIGTLETGSGNVMEFSSPPEFKGVEGRIVPEELFVASENTCILLTFIAYAEKMRVEFLSYDCDAVGYLEQGETGLVITRIVLRPKIVVKSEEDVRKTERALELSLSRCFIANSIKSRVEVEPEIVVSE
ncbi:MAG: OsmC family peroxiredoxin [Methanomassiliicoccales archaeon]|nr:MAG: OsmC family peroxiredoxin [Methanomassiliicoccales archaeon]